MTAALVDEAIKKAAVAWIAVGDRPAVGLWCMPLEGSLIVVSGPGEQNAPGLAEATHASVHLRGDTGGLIVIAEATVDRIAPDSDEWTTVAPQVANKRLNASGTADALAARWAQAGCAVVRVTPVPDNAVSKPHLPDVSEASPPRDTPARVEVRRPFRLHRVRKH